MLAAAVVPVLLTQLGTAPFGLWALLWSFSAVNGWPSVATVGLGVACTRRVAAAAVAGRPAEAAGVVTLFALVGVVLGVTMTAAGGLLLPTIVGGDSGLGATLGTAARWAGLWIGAEATVMGCGAVLEGRQRVDLARGLDAARRTTVTGAAVLAAVATGDLAAVMAASALAALLVAGAATLITALTNHAFAPLGRPRGLRALVVDASRLTTLNASGVVHRSMDRLLVAMMVGPTAVAAVEIASRLRDIAQLVLSTSSYTAISASSWLDAQRAHAKLHDLVAMGTRFTLLATWSVAAVLAAYAAPLLELWLGDQMPDDVQALALLGLAYTAVSAPFQVGVNVLTGAGRVGPLARAAWAGVLANLGASIVLIDAMGVAGAFVGTLVGSAVVIPLLLPLVLEVSDMDAGSAFRRVVVPVFPPVVLLILTGLIVVSAGWPPLVTVAIGAVLSAAVAVPAAMRWTITTADLEGLRVSEPLEPAA